LQVVATSPIEFPQTIKTSQLHGPNTVLIGDAAHCVTPILGQGANAALKDVSVLSDTITTPLPGRKHPPTISELPEAFTKTRLADAQALVDLNRFALFATSLGPLIVLPILPIGVHVMFRLVLSVLPIVPKPELLKMAEGGSYHKMIKQFVADVVLACIVFVVVVTGAIGKLRTCCIL
jgi:2-polyprenyl-6-methoxyphenol hydroxylase-like FAD-dependent oxidoreductase